MLSNPNWSRRYNDLYKPGCYVIDQSGQEPFAWQCGNRPEYSDVADNRSARIHHRLFVNISFLYLKILSQQGGVAFKASDAAVGVLKNDKVKLSSTSRSLARNLTDPSK